MKNNEILEAIKNGFIILPKALEIQKITKGKLINKYIIGTKIVTQKEYGEYQKFLNKIKEIK